MRFFGLTATWGDALESVSKLADETAGRGCPTPMPHGTILTERAPLLPPDPRAGRRRFGPTLLAAFGLVGIGVMFVYRERLRPAPPAEASISVPTLVQAATIFKPLEFFHASAISTPAAPAAPKPVARVIDPFVTSLAPPKPTPAEAPAPAPTLRLQSILIGARGRSCLIDGTLCRVGDRVADATVAAIERNRVIVKIAGRDVELRMNK